MDETAERRAVVEARLYPSTARYIATFPCLVQLVAVEMATGGCGKTPDAQAAVWQDMSLLGQLRWMRRAQRAVNVIRDLAPDTTPAHSKAGAGHGEGGA